jgi:hypothetical protein
MKTAAHLEKFRRLHSVVQRLDIRNDCELWIWTAMNACSHLLNAALHHVGATEEIDSFHSQVEGLYCVPDRTNGTTRDTVHVPGDVMHVNQPPIRGPLPAGIRNACAMLQIIENLREPYVRGSQPVSVNEVGQWKHAYRTCVIELSCVLNIAAEETT